MGSFIFKTHGAVDIGEILTSASYGDDTTYERNSNMPLDKDVTVPSCPSLAVNKCGHMYCCTMLDISV